MKRGLSVFLLVCLIVTTAAGCQSKKASAAQADEIDLDLSKMSEVLAYSQVINFYESPDDYMGKRIRIEGKYFASYFDLTDLMYHYIVVIADVTCCQIGLEFQWKGEHAYPDDYPEDGTDIEMVGVLNSYEELGKNYIYLDIDDITVAEK